jgi:hypothetical protein
MDDAAKVAAVADPPPHPQIMDIHFGKGETVTLVVGEEKYEMLVHANYISSNFEFIKTALKREWLEGQTRTITLPVDDPKTVTHYLYFTYSGRLPTTHIVGPITKDSTRTDKIDLARLYVLGGRLLDDVIRKALIQEMIRIPQLTRTYPGQSAVAIIYEGTPEGDPARKLLVNLYASEATKDWIHTAFNPIFLLDLARELLRKAEQGVAPKLYRQHDLVASDHWT